MLNNLLIAFPEKSQKERADIARQFYKNFTDTFIETIKLISAGKTFVNRHFSANYEVLEKVEEMGKKCQIHSGHNFNWEFANLAVPLNVKQDFIVVYMPLGNKIFDRIFKKLRSKNGTILLPATKLRSAILPWRNKQYILTLLADQNPAVPENAFWINFFGRPTPFLRGPESGTRSTDISVVFANISKVKRGYYYCHFTLVEENQSILKKGGLTVKYAHSLEEFVKANPSSWLWSHRRWKFEWKPEYGMVLN